MTHYLHNNKLYEIDRMPPDRIRYYILGNPGTSFDEDKYNADVAAFRAYLATLTPIPHELKGEGVVALDRDFKWDLRGIGDPLYGSTGQPSYKAWQRVAVPIEAKEQASGDENDEGEPKQYITDYTKPAPQQQPAKETMLEQLADLLRKYDVRKYVNVNDSGYSQVERDIVDLFASQQPQQQAGMEESMDVRKLYDELVRRFGKTIADHLFSTDPKRDLLLSTSPLAQQQVDAMAKEDVIKFTEWCNQDYYVDRDGENEKWFAHGPIEGKKRVSYTTADLYALFTSQHVRREIEDYILREKSLRGQIEVLKEELTTLRETTRLQHDAMVTAENRGVEKGMQQQGDAGNLENDKSQDDLWQELFDLINLKHNGEFPILKQRYHITPKNKQQ